MHCWRSFSALVSFAVILLFGIFAVPARGEIFYDIGVKTIYEDNVVGLLSDNGGAGGSAIIGAKASAPGMPGPGPIGGTSYTGTSTGKKSDISFDITAGIGASTRLGKNTEIFLSGGVERITYDAFTELNMTAGALSAGITQYFGDKIGARLAATGVVKRFEETARDSSAYGANILFRESISSRFWLKESFAYEQNDADTEVFAYTGNVFNLRAGYEATDRTTLLAGYSYLVRDYDDGSEENADMFSLAIEWELVRNWFLDLQYDRRYSYYTDPTFQESDTTANIYSIGVQYSY